MELNLKRLRAERIARDITQDEMAHLMGWTSRSPYAKRENGFVDIGTNEFIKMAYILGYNKDNLGIFFTSNVPEKERRENRKEIIL